MHHESSYPDINKNSVGSFLITQKKLKLNDSTFNSNNRVHRSLSDSKYGNIQNKNYRNKYLNENKKYDNSNNNKNTNNLKKNIENKNDCKTDNKILNECINNSLQYNLLNEIIDSSLIIPKLNNNTFGISVANSTESFNSTTTATTTISSTITTPTTKFQKKKKNLLKCDKQTQKLCNDINETYLHPQLYHSRTGGSLGENQHSPIENCCNISSASLLSLV